MLTLPQASVAFQWRVIVLVLPQPATTVSVKVIATLPQVSLPVAVPVPAGLVSPVHSTVAFGGTVRFGGVVSTTEIDCEHAAALPQLSTALQARVIVCVLPQPGTLVSL